MSADVIKDAAETILTGLPYASGDTVLTVQNGDSPLFPDTATESAFDVWLKDERYASLRDAIDSGAAEKIRVTDNQTTNTWTVTRGQNAEGAIALLSGVTYKAYQAVDGDYFNDVISQTEEAKDAAEAAQSATEGEVQEKRVKDHGYFAGELLKRHKIGEPLDLEFLAEADVKAPPSGIGRLFFNTDNGNALSYKDSTGTVTAV